MQATASVASFVNILVDARRAEEAEGLLLGGALSFGYFCVPLWVLFGYAKSNNPIT